MNVTEEILRFFAEVFPLLTASNVDDSTRRRNFAYAYLPTKIENE